MWNRRTRILTLMMIFGLLGVGYVYALRASRPVTLNYPITEEQISQLNKYLEDIWNVQNGRFEIDVVTTTKSSSKNGEFWIIQTGATATIQFKAGNHIYTVNAF